MLEGGSRFIEQSFRKRVRLRCDGEPATVALAEQSMELLPGLVVLQRTPRHDCPANPAERGIRTLEEQFNVMRLNNPLETSG